MSSGLALLPLAPISAVTKAELPGIIKRMEQRLSSRRGRKQAPLVWGAAYILLGLRYSPALAAQLFRGVLSMKESSTYQAILEEGRSEGALVEAKKFLRIVGDGQFGPPDDRTAETIEGIEDVARLENLASRLQEAKSWQELLSLPAGSPRKRRHRQSS